MLEFETDLVGKDVEFGFLRKQIEPYGFSIGGNWDYDKGSFDTVLSKEEGETIYLRLPFVAIDGQLDAASTQIRFLKPYVIKHIANIGLEYDGSSLMDATGLSQFQTPVEKDAHIEQQHKWVNVGKQVVESKVLPYLN